MIRSTKTTLKFSNKEKLNTLHEFIAEYRSVVSFFVDLVWEMDKLPSLLPKEITSQVSTWLSARAVQCAAKQASGIVRGTKKKQEKRLFIINKMTEKGEFKKARKLQQIYDKANISKPTINNVEPELDERFIDIDLDNVTSFDGWVTVSSIGRKLKLQLPFKKTKHFNKMSASGVMKKGIRLSNKSITFIFDLLDPVKVVSGNTLGIDIGQTTTLSISTGQSIQMDSHGWDYKKIGLKLSGKKKGSKGFERTRRHRTNYINWSVKQIKSAGVKKINIERIKNIHKGKKSSRSLSHWNYKELLDKLESHFFELGVQVQKVNPTYTSQRCSLCGWTCKGNRKGKLFKCKSCGFSQDADLNASLNLSFNLRPIGQKERLQQNNRKGFYWSVVSEEPIVPHVQKAG